jgi:hypothetical protein
MRTATLLETDPQDEGIVLLRFWAALIRPRCRAARLFACHGEREGERKGEEGGGWVFLK